ncbi:3-phosphoserine/phosphohydroxythreonine transaminase [Vagococcus vulneris]|uniref:Phosphoserine aminotransferase n=1 Tax=Vagococcus vulneris TaxID=1977869 RepID=A0A430A0J8_9ENTE|nr:3-phosphoserine/phosphohydroxythreonine transaminase [Vagococcus vulneris]RST99849.1 phosphoserine transaminase [Vagococcus vulneris]
MVYNFSAGPAMLPKPVLLRAQQELGDYQNSGMSVMEMSHRSSIYDNIHHQTKKLLKELMMIPDDYEILFLQGGASLQFTMVPLNLRQTGKVGYIDTGVWSKKAITEAKKLGNYVNILASSQDKSYQEIPPIPENFPDDLDYIHVTTNNTIEGTAYTKIPKTGKIPLVADMSSNILSNDYHVSDFDLIYAGAQKNIGPAGVTLVVIKKELLNRCSESVPSMMQYAIHAKNDSLYNTPPTYGIYMMSLVLEWLKDFGGQSAMLTYNQKKAALLYDYLDQSPMFSSPVKPSSRSLTNIPFVSTNADNDKKFIAYAEKQGLINLKGHRSVGGMRASLYNAMPLEGVQALIQALDTFEKEYNNQ